MGTGKNLSVLAALGFMAAVPDSGRANINGTSSSTVIEIPSQKALAFFDNGRPPEVTDPAVDTVHEVRDLMTRALRLDAPKDIYTGLVANSRSGVNYPDTFVISDGALCERTSGPNGAMIVLPQGTEKMPPEQQYIAMMFTRLCSEGVPGITDSKPSYVFSGRNPAMYEELRHGFDVIYSGLSKTPVKPMPPSRAKTTPKKKS